MFLFVLHWKKKSHAEDRRLKKKGMIGASLSTSKHLISVKKTSAWTARQEIREAGGEKGVVFKTICSAQRGASAATFMMR